MCAVAAGADRSLCIEGSKEKGSIGEDERRDTQSYRAGVHVGHCCDSYVESFLTFFYV